MKKTLFFICFLLSACNLNNNFLYQDEYGRNIYQVDCGGTDTSYVRCYQTMNNICKYGYEILKYDEKITGSATNNYIDNNQQYNGYNNASLYGSFGVPNLYNTDGANYQTINTTGITRNLYSRYIVYTCK